MSKVLEIKTNLTGAMKEKDKDKVVMLRIILSELENKKVEEKLNKVEDLTDNQVEQVLVGQVKKLEQELEGLKKAGRDVEKVEKQREVVLEYLPKQLTEDEVREYVEKSITELGITSIKEQGKLMGKLSQELKGKTDLGKVSKLVRELLQ